MDTALQWSRFLMSGAVLVLGLMVPAPAVGQTLNGPFFKQLELGLFYPAYLQRDSALIAEELGLSEEERAIVEAVINQYALTFDEESRRVHEGLRKAAGATAGDLPDMDLRTEIRDRARIQMQPAGNAVQLTFDREETEARRSRAVGVIREELDLTLDDPMTDSSRSVLIHEWSERRLILENELHEKFDLIKGVDQSHWDAVKRALRRINTAWPDAFRAEGTDLDQLLAEHFGRHSSIYRSLAADRLQYAIEYDEVLDGRNDILASTTPALLDARDRTQLEKALSLGARQVQARAAVVDKNREWLARFLEQIDDDVQRENFQRYANKEMYPDAHFGDPPEAAINYLLQSGTMNDELTEILVTILEEYQSERYAWRVVAIELFPNWERDRLLQELESNTIALAYTTWLDGLRTQRSSLPAWKKHLDAGIQLDKDYALKIREIIGSETYGAIPGRHRTARRPDHSRGPVPNQKRTANVVYWDELMRTQDAKSNR